MHDHDLVGGPFSVLESDPGVFTTLVRSLGIPNIEVVELFDIEPWATDHIGLPYGLIFCFLYHKDQHRVREFEDPSADRIWFANQLCDDACASQALLNIVLNADIPLGDTLEAFRRDTSQLSPLMRGLAVSNSRFIRQVHNSLSRPADIRGSLSSIAKATLDVAIKKERPSKRRKTDDEDLSDSSVTRQARKTTVADPEEAYHFIGYIPAHGKVWELDGLKPGPLEVGVLPTNPGGGGLEGWMDVARPALRLKMKKYGGEANGTNIRFSLMALVADSHLEANDRLEMLKRRKIQLERRLDHEFPQGWRSQVDSDLHLAASRAFATSINPAGELGSTFAPDFGARHQKATQEVIDMPADNLLGAWKACIQSAESSRPAVEDGLAKSAQIHTEEIKRTFDYEPFIREFLVRLHGEGLLNPLLGRDEHGKKVPTKAKTG